MASRRTHPLEFKRSAVEASKQPCASIAAVAMRASTPTRCTNGKAVGTVGPVRGLINKASKRVARLIQRENSTLFVPIDLGEAK